MTGVVHPRASSSIIHLASPSTPSPCRSPCPHTVHNRFLNFHGQTHARLGRDQSVYNTVKTRRTPLIRVLAPLFWNAPEVHLRGLERIWTDGIIAIIPWGGFIGKLQNEWQEFVLYVRIPRLLHLWYLSWYVRLMGGRTGDGAAERERGVPRDPERRHGRRACDGHADQQLLVDRDERRVHPRRAAPHSATPRQVEGDRRGGGTSPNVAMVPKSCC